MPFNTCKSELRYSNALRNASVLNKCHFENFAKNRLPWQHPLKNWKKGMDREISRKYLSFGEKIVKIGSVDPGIIWLKLKKEEINAGKTYSPVGKCAEWAKNDFIVLSMPNALEKWTRRRVPFFLRPAVIMMVFKT